MNMRGTAHLLLRLGDGGHVRELALALEDGLDLLQLFWLEGKQLCELWVNQLRGFTLNVTWEAPYLRHFAEMLLARAVCVEVVRGGW